MRPADEANLAAHERERIANEREVRYSGARGQYRRSDRRGQGRAGRRCHSRCSS